LDFIRVGLDLETISRVKRVDKIYMERSEEPKERRVKKLVKKMKSRVRMVFGGILWWIKLWNILEKP
jgi:hypothetical protein